MDTTNVYFRFVDGNNQEIKNYTPDIPELYLEIQVAGEIQQYTYVEIGLFPSSGPLSPGSLGVSYWAWIPLNTFIMRDMVKIGIKKEGQQSLFAHRSKWIENANYPNMYMDIDYPLQQTDVPQREMKLSIMVNGINSLDDMKTFFRQEDVLHCVYP